jgi:IPT/TIG domain
MGKVCQKFNRVFRFTTVITLGLAASFSAAQEPVEAPFNGVSLSVQSPTVPPGGTLQVQVFVTEPNPILKGRQGMKLGSARSALVPAALIPNAGVAPAAILASIRDAAVYSPTGDADGIAVGKNGSTQLFFNSPLTTFGTELDTPVMTIAVPVTAGAKVGQTVPLTLDASNSLYYNPSSKLYAVELKSGTMTVGGTMSISDVTPGGGTVQPGTVISIKGVGFDPSCEVDINEAKIASIDYISPTLIQVTLSKAFAIRGRRIRVTNSNNEKVTYYPYQRSTAVGKSTHALIASSMALFAQTTWKLGYFHPTLQGTIFGALALQNLNTVKANVVLQLKSKTGSLLATKNITLGVNASMTRDFKEYFPGASPATGTSVSVSSDQPIQMLGMLADDSTSIVLPIDPTTLP